MAMLVRTWRDPRQSRDNDPIDRARALLLSDPSRLGEVEERVEREMAGILSAALQGETA